MSVNRRDFLLFLGAGLATTACGNTVSDRLTSGGSPTASPAMVASPSKVNLPFQPVSGPMPLATDGIAKAKHVIEYTNYTVADDLILPQGFTYDVIGAWGDRLGDSRFGYNNDYLAFVETGPNEGLLTINFEYISALPWMQTYSQVIGQSLPFKEVQQAIDDRAKAAGDSFVGLNAFALAEDDPLKAKVKEICQQALIDQGLGVITIKRNASGRWEHTPSTVDRRVTGISGLLDQRYLKSTGAATAVFRKTTGQGYIDNLGDRIIGTFQNCAGGLTPWGTVLSAEENVQNQIPEWVYADGTSYDPKECPFRKSDDELNGQANVFGLAGNKYGWIVEIDPADPQDYGTKHTWLGRYRHEAVGIRVEVGKPIAFYSGCDRRGGHLYKFVSQGKVSDPKAKANSQLLSEGMLYAARFNPDGTGEWLPLKPETPINPNLPSDHVGDMILLPRRPEGGVFRATSSDDIAEFKNRFKTLAELYEGNDQEKQGAILIDAHYAANAIGATCTARPEDTDIAPDGSLFIAFTSGAPSREDGSPDVHIFKPVGYEYGWLMRLEEEGGEPDALKFRWKIFATGGEPDQGGSGFANPDNLAFDPKGNLWVVTDMSTSMLNRPVPENRREKGLPMRLSPLRGLFGNNTIWYIPTQGENAGNAYLFGIAPMETETCGPFFTADGQTLFAAIQHPGEFNGTRRDMATEVRQFAMHDLDGQEFIQTRKVPIGSNWPGKKPNDPPRPAVVAIRRSDNRPFI